MVDELKKENDKEFEEAIRKDIDSTLLGLDFTTAPPKVDEKEELEEELEEEEEEESEEEEEEEEDSSTDPPKSEAPTTDPPKDELEEIRLEMERILAEKYKPEDDKKVSEKKEETSTEEKKEDEDEVVDFVKELNLDYDELDTPKAFNAVANAIYKKLRSGGASREKAIDVSQIVMASIEQQRAMEAVNRKFYEDNPDLAKYKNSVKRIGAQLAENEEDENISVEDFLVKVAKESRRRLKLPEVSDSEKKSKNGKPKFPKVKGAKVKKTKESRSEFEKDLDDAKRLILD